MISCKRPADGSGRGDEVNEFNKIMDRDRVQRKGGIGEGRR